MKKNENFSFKISNTGRKVTNQALFTKSVQLENSLLTYFKIFKYLSVKSFNVGIEIWKFKYSKLKLRKIYQ